MYLALDNTARIVAAMNDWTLLAKAKMKELKLTQERLAEILGVTQGAVAHWLGGRREPDLQTIAAILNVLGLPPLKITQPGDELSAPRTPTEADYALIPQLSAIGTGGDSGHLNDHVEVKGGLAFKREWLARMKVKPETCCVIYAQGSSMEPFIFEGDVALIDYSDPTPRDGKVYAIRRQDGGVSIKRMVQQLSGGWIIRSDNPDKSRYGDETVSEDTLHEMPIIGRVVWRGGGM